MTIPAKLAAAALVLLAVGVPVLETWEALFLAASWLAIVLGTVTAGRWRSLAALTIVVAVFGLKAILPRANIAEAHNAFLVVGQGEPLEQGLPPQIFRSWKAHLDAFYPEPARAEGEGPGAYQWRDPQNAPEALFTASTDAIWRRAIFTRQVDAIGFSSIGEFRGGFANETGDKVEAYRNLYNFWNGPLQRQSMPFYVMYRLTRASVGSRLAWKGQLFWERADGAFDEVVHADGVASRTIEPPDAGKRVYAAFFPARTPDMYFALEPSLTLRLAGWADALLTLAGGLVVLTLMVRLEWSRYLTALGLLSASYLVMAILRSANSGYLGKAYAPFRGGDDGMLHDGYGRAMAMLARRGDVVDALKGMEPAYWFTPGMRYFRMVEKLIFGDTNHLHALVLACLPVVLFYLIRDLAGNRWAWIATIFFCAVPVGNLSFLQYISYANEGYGEGVAAGLFLLGLTLVLRTQRTWGGTETGRTVAWLAGASLAGAMFIRPNLALAVIWLGAAFAWASLRRADLRMVVALACGLGLALWMPLHNWLYAREFYFISKSGASVALPIGVGDYASALGDVARGRFDTDQTAVVRTQLRGWLAGPGFLGVNVAMLAWIARAMRLFALGVTCWVAFRWMARRLPDDPDLGVIAVAALLAQVPMLFVHSTVERYAVVGWDLCLIVLIGWQARRVRAGGPARDSGNALSYAR